MAVFPHNPIASIAAAAASNLLTETFETTTGDGTDESWALDAFTNSDTNANTGAAPLAGSRSFFVSSGDSGDNAVFALGAAYSELWIYFIYERDAQSNNGNAFGLWNSSNSRVMRGRPRNNTNIFAYCSSTTSGSISLSSGSGTPRHFWFRWKKGTGSNGELDGYVSDNATRPGSPTDSTVNGNATDDATQFFITAYGDSITIDNIIVSENEIGSNPL